MKRDNDNKGAEATEEPKKKVATEEVTEEASKKVTTADEVTKETNEEVTKETTEEVAASDDDDDDIGPMPAPPPGKKRKVLEFESTYLRALPKAKCYEKSFMHRDTITHIIATKTDFVITASADGNVKFWKKQHCEGIEFVKHFRCHQGAIVCMCISSSGQLMCTVGADKSIKVFEVVNFDMINMIRVDFQPLTAQCIHGTNEAISTIAVTDADSSWIRIFDARSGEGTPLHVLDRLHASPVAHIEYIPSMELCVSADVNGMLEYWCGAKGDFEHPANVQWKFKTDTDLYDIVKCKTKVLSLVGAPDGKHFALMARDRKIRIYRTTTGKIVKVLDESLSTYLAAKSTIGLSNTEFNRRIAVEKELDSAVDVQQTISYDLSGNFLLYPTMLGIKVINLTTNECVRMIGKPETLRLLTVSVCRSMSDISEQSGGVAPDANSIASENPALKQAQPDPMIVCNAYKKHRFYLFTNSEPFEAGIEKKSDRDVYNERPLKQDIITAVDEVTAENQRLADSCIIHTTMGDIHLRLHVDKVAKTVENFVTHARKGYFNGLIFHRVIRSFMIQTGDPTGTGMGGESIWGGEFEDEIHPNLRHDKPYTVSMANAGPNTNGSQFFITVVPTPWLDGRHTIFGRVVKGMEAVMEISKVGAHPKTGRPEEEISIVSITLGDHTKDIVE